MLRGGARARLLQALELPTSADIPAIKARYRELAKAHHPDVNRAAPRARRFARVADAYQKLIGDANGDSADNVSGPADDTVGPAMQARWNIRRRCRANTQHGSSRLSTQ